VRVFDPAHHPARIDLGADFCQARRDLRNVFVALDQMAAGATDLFEKPLAFGQQRRDVGEFLNIEVAGGTARLHLFAAQQWKLPEMHFTVRLFNAVDSNALAFVAPRATEPLRRVSVIGEQHFAPRVSSEGVRFLLESGAVDRQMAGYATIDT